MSPTPTTVASLVTDRWGKDGLSGLLIHELIAAQARSRPDALAVSAPDSQRRYEELKKHSNRLAHLLRASGVRAERPGAHRLRGRLAPLGLELEGEGPKS